MSKVSMLDWALKYAKIGWKVFPVNQSKQPLISNGLKGASAEETQIKKWWKAHPDAGIGVATGMASGIVVLDIDLDKPGAEQNLEKIIHDKGMFPQTVAAKSGGGGLHFYFKHPNNGKKVANAQKLLGLAGIDVRGDGGYIVVPPTMHASGNRYEWGDDQSPFDTTPDMCPEYIYNDRAAGRAAQRFNYTGEIADGERNTTLTSVAGLLRSLGLGIDEITLVLKQQNATRCNPPLSDTEVETIAHYITEYPPAINRTNTRTGRIGLEELLSFERSDVGFGQMLAFALLGKVKYNHTQGKWLLWQDHFWKPDGVEEITLKTIDVTMMFRESVELITDEDERDRGLKYSQLIQNKPRIEAGLSIARAQPSIATVHTDWDKGLDVIAVENGVIELKTGELRDGKPEDLISYHVPLNYDPKTDCPLWKKFLSEVFDGNAEVIEFVRRAVGYSLTGQITEQCLFLLVGKGANGKSTFLDTLHEILGIYSYSAPFSTFERTQNSGSQQTNDIASLAGKRLVSASEPNEGVTLSESRIKSLTGGEHISARFLHQEFFEFKPTFKIWLGVNHLPRVLDDSDGFWRRVRRIDFPVKFYSPDEEHNSSDKPKDKELPARLRAEHAGILNWAVQGAVDWYKSGLKTPVSVSAATQTYRTDSDPLHEFFAEHCMQGPEYEILGDSIFKAYTSHCHIRMLKNFEIMSSTRFHQKLGRQFVRSTINGARGYIGIGLKPESMFLLDSDSPTIAIKKVARTES